MKKNLIRLTEADLHRIIKESVNRILKEEFEIDSNSDDTWGNVNKWQAAAHEIQTKGSTIINLPTSDGNFIHARLMKTQRGGVYLETKDIRKEFSSISDAFKALQDCASKC